MDDKEEELTEKIMYFLMLFFMIATMSIVAIGYIYLILRDSNFLDISYQFLSKNPSYIFYIAYFICFIGIVILCYYLFKIPNSQISYKDELRLKKLDELRKMNEEFDKELGLK